MENSLKTKKKSFIDDAVKFSFLSILLGLLVGAIVLIISGNSPIEAYGAMIEGIIGKPKYIAWTIIKATPYILT
ncbi:MAG TPA: ABC transporter permease, partial [Terrisporobacter glycolicus]|nr:ABC transporter permease [Terrisporobacter hibernicus]